MTRGFIIVTILSAALFMRDVYGQTNCPVITAMPNFHTIGADPVFDSTSPDDCRSRCLANPACFGWEIDRYPVSTRLSECWHYFSPIDLSTDNSYEDPNIDLFIIVIRNAACTSSPAPVTTGIATTVITTTTTPASTTIFTNGSCFTFTAFPGEHRVGATPQPQLTTDQLCLDNCGINIDCYGYEIDKRNPPLCWFQLEPVDINDLYNDNPLVTLFVISRFPCTTSSSPATGPATGGVTGVTTGGVTGGITSPRPSGLCANFNMTVDANYVLATQIPGIANAAACRQYCLDTSATCLAYQDDLIDPAAYKCWVNDASGIAFGLFGTVGVTTYTRLGDTFLCNSTTSGVTGLPSGATGGPTGGPTGQPSLCATYVNLTGEHSLFATEQPGLDSA